MFILKQTCCWYIPEDSLLPQTCRYGENTNYIILLSPWCMMMGMNAYFRWHNINTGMACDSKVLLQNLASAQWYPLLEFEHFKVKGYSSIKLILIIVTPGTMYFQKWKLHLHSTLVSIGLWIFVQFNRLIFWSDSVVFATQYQMWRQRG